METSPLSVSIDFDSSHLFFPTIIHWALALLFALVVVFRLVPFLAAVKRGEKTLRSSASPWMEFVSSARWC